MEARLVPCALFASVLGAAGLLAMTDAPAAPRAKAGVSRQPGLPLDVTFDPENLDPATQRLYQAMRDAINGNAIIPNARTTYFSAVSDVNGYGVDGWTGCIADVRHNDSGNLVTVDIIPCLSCDWAACAVITNSDYAEQYQVFPDGTFQYVGSLDPQGLAGQMPTMRGL